MRRNELLNCACFRAAILLAIAVLACSSGCSTPAAAVVAEAAPTVGSSLNTSALKLLDLDGKPFDLKTSSEGRVHVALFTRTDCPVSNQCAPEVRELYEKLHSKGVDV